METKGTEHNENGFHRIDLSEPTLRDAYDFLKTTGVTLDHATEAVAEEEGLTERAMLLIAALVWVSERKHRSDMTLDDAYDAPMTAKVLKGEEEIPTLPT